MIHFQLKKNNIKAGVTYLFANILNKAISFLTVPIFARLLTTKEYGIVSTYLSYVLILQYIMGLSSEYTIRNAYVDFRDDIQRYMTSIFSLSIVSMLITSTVVFVLNYTFRISSIGLVCACLVHSYAMYIINAASFKMMMDRDYWRRSILLAGPSIVSAASGLILVFVLSQGKSSTTSTYPQYHISEIISPFHRTPGLGDPAIPGSEKEVLSHVH